MGLTTGAVTRVIDRLEQAGYVRRTTDPADRRRVVVEVVPERVATVQSLLDVARARVARGGRPLLAGAARAHQRLPVADGRPHPGRGGAAPDLARRRPIGADRSVGACRAARVAHRRATDVPVGRPGPPAARGPRAASSSIGPGSTARPRRCGSATAASSSSTAASRSTGASGSRRSASTRRSPGRSSSSAASTGIEADLRDVDVRALRADRRLRADPARARPAARRGPGQDRRRCQGDPARAPGRDAGPAPAPGRHRQGRLDGQALGKKGGDVTLESRGWAAASGSLRARGRRRLEVDRHRRGPGP